MQSEIIYIGDPMCSWCYGFSPVIQEIYEKFRNEVSMTLTMGGLHPGNDYIVNDRYKAFLLDHWGEVGQRTGQPFSFGILDNTGWVYDTEKACRAAVTARTLKPGSEFAYFAAIQKGFYFHNRDPHDPDTFAGVAEDMDIDRKAFLEAYVDPAMRDATAGDFAWSRSMGVNGFPTVLVRDERGYAILTHGYQPLDALEGLLKQWLDSRPA